MAGSNQSIGRPPHDERQRMFERPQHPSQAHRPIDYQEDSLDKIPAHVSAAIVTIFVVTILAFGPPDRVAPVLDLFETVTSPAGQRSA